MLNNFDTEFKKVSDDKYALTIDYIMGDCQIIIVLENEEERLRRENYALKQQLLELEEKYLMYSEYDIIKNIYYKNELNKYERNGEVFYAHVGISGNKHHNCREGYIKYSLHCDYMYSEFNRLKNKTHEAYKIGSSYKKDFKYSLDFDIRRYSDLKHTVEFDYVSQNKNIIAKDLGYLLNDIQWKLKCEIINLEIGIIELNRGGSSTNFLNLTLQNTGYYKALGSSKAKEKGEKILIITAYSTNVGDKNKLSDSVIHKLTYKKYIINYIFLIHY